MAGTIAERLLRHRKKLKMTQDQLGSMYNISGPAVFKFEKGYVIPSLELWLRLAKDMKIGQEVALLMHVQEKLPTEYKEYADWESIVAEDGAEVADQEDFTKYKSTEDLRQAVASHQWLPTGLSDLARTRGLWSLYQPNGQEINTLADFFTPLGEGSPRDFCDALNLLRAFKGKKA